MAASWKELFTLIVTIFLITTLSSSQDAIQTEQKGVVNKSTVSGLRTVALAFLIIKHKCFSLIPPVAVLLLVLTLRSCYLCNWKQPGIVWSCESIVNSRVLCREFMIVFGICVMCKPYSYFKYLILRSYRRRSVCNKWRDGSETFIHAVQAVLYVTEVTNIILLLFV